MSEGGAVFGAVAKGIAIAQGWRQGNVRSHVSQGRGSVVEKKLFRCQRSLIWAAYNRRMFSPGGGWSGSLVPVLLLLLPAIFSIPGCEICGLTTPSGSRSTTVRGVEGNEIDQRGPGREIGMKERTERSRQSSALNDVGHERRMWRREKKDCATLPQLGQRQCSVTSLVPRYITELHTELSRVTWPTDLLRGLLGDVLWADVDSYLATKKRAGGFGDGFCSGDWDILQHFSYTPETMSNILGMYLILTHDECGTCFVERSAGNARDTSGYQQIPCLRPASAVSPGTIRFGCICLCFLEHGGFHLSIPPPRNGSIHSTFLDKPPCYMGPCSVKLPRTSLFSGASGSRAYISYTQQERLILNASGLSAPSL
ncbi:hypothetical protein BU15DRAFT_65289 [Melanogaster broomeanus]|nr:hypothetical protein BU15DRAFT_65289 [Melanogaster broomeanus]